MPTTSLKILVATTGTLGDLLPFIALGQRLKSRGHDVTIACPTGLSQTVERSGLKTAPFDGDFGKETAQKHAKHWNHWHRFSSNERKPDYGAFIEKMVVNSRELTHLASNAELLLTPTNCPEGRLAHELSNKRWIPVIFVPEEAFQPKEISDADFTKAVNTLLRRLGLKEPYATYRRFTRSNPTLYACTKALGCPTDPEIRQTGFWFYEDPEWANWQPDSRLTKFMEEALPPLVLTFSSLPLENPKEILEIHVRAASLVGRKLIVQEGWSGFSKDLLPHDMNPDDVYMADFIPHDWFFARAAGVITHGGIGTLGRALRHGCPVLVEPYGNDQFFNALLVKRLGVGAAVHPHRLTAEGLARVIQEKLLSDEARARAKWVASLIQEEDGVKLACEIIEKYMSNKSGDTA